MATKWTPSQQLAMQLHGQDLLISAAAGSGKTATLTERIIRELTGSIETEDGRTLPPADISRMLIVTFTRAAAAELRSRLSAALSAAIAAHPDDRHLYRQLVALSSASICTIDSFYLQPVRANFERLGLPSSFRLADDGELAPLKSDTLQRLIDEAYTHAAPENVDDDAPLSVLDGNAFARAMDDLMPNRDRGENTEVLLKLYEKLLAFPDGLECLRTSADRLREQADLPFCQTAIGMALSTAICEQLVSLQAQCQAACDTFAGDEAATALYLPAAHGDLETVERCLLCLQTGDWDAARDTALTYAPIRLKSSRKLTPSPEAIMQKESRAARVKAIRALATYFADDADTRRTHMLQTAQTEQMLYTLLSDYDRAIREIKLRRGVQDFTDIRRALLTLLLDENGKPSDIALALQEQYDAIYIDEYQDVDTVQDTIFATIAASGNRFMVGDIKQSIYSFRGAEPSIFADYRRRFTPIAPQDLPTEQNGACLFMSENFRCDREVIDFTNAVCGYTFGVCRDTLGYCRDDDLICGKDPDATRPAHPVQVVLLEKNSSADGNDDDGNDDLLEDETGSTTPTAAALNPEAIYIAGEIARLIQEEKLDDGSPIRPRDIAVLMRSTTMADALSRALAAYGIETTHRASSSLATHPDMTALINLLSVIDNPRDDVPLTALLTDTASPLSLEDLLCLRTAAPECITIPLYDVLTLAATAQAPLESIGEAIAKKCADFVAFVQHWRSVAQTLPVDKLLRKLYGEPSLRDKASSPVYLTVYDRARHYQNTSFCGLYQFLRYFRRLLSAPGALSSAAAADGEQDAVTILSIHKSKGLEFPVVFVADCNAPFNTKDLHAPIIFDHALGAAARIYCPEDTSRRESVVRHAIAARLRVRQSEEEMRILYVALTRARERLYLTAKLRSTAATALERTDRPTRDSRADILSAQSYISWVLAALSPANRERDLSDIYQLRILDRALYTADALPHHKPISPAAMQKATDDTGLPAAECNPGSAAFYRAVLREHASYDDPNALLRTLPTKAAASKLRRDLLDRHFLPESISEDDQTPPPPNQKHADTEDYIRHRIALLRSATTSLPEIGQKVTAAERGTATHLFLQYCDHHALAAHGVDAEIERLVHEHFLTPRVASLLHRRQLQNFVKSELFAQILSAKTVWRELQFNRFLPYRDMTEQKELASRLGDSSLYVQGSLDLLLEHEDGSLTLCDYKTDRLRAENWGTDIAAAERDAAIRRQLLADHGDQLAIYADAVRGMFGQAPAHILIYSLPLGVAVDMGDCIDGTHS